jgi:nitrous oxidase accessory protein NosD
MRTLALALVLGSLGGVAEAGEIRVSDGGDLAGAVARAWTGDTVIVEPGVYHGNVRFSHDGVTVKAETPGTVTVHALDQSRPVFEGYGVEDIALSGVVVYGGLGADGMKFTQAGSGGRDPVRGIRITSNTIRGSGLDGIKIAQGDRIEVSGNMVEDSRRGQGVDFMAVTNSRISNNTIVRSGLDSAIVVKGGSANVVVVANLMIDCADDCLSVGGWSEKFFWTPEGLGHGCESLNVVAVGNTIRGARKNGIIVPAACRATIMGNRVSGVGGAVLEEMRRGENRDNLLDDNGTSVMPRPR